MTERIILDETQFKHLVAGWIVRTGNAELILADIGWDRMLAAINHAMSLSESDWNPYERKIIGAMKNTIDDHGPITKDLISSVMKRFRGLVNQQKDNNDASGS